jgi:hypothetical protein
MNLVCSETTRPESVTLSDVLGAVAVEDSKSQLFTGYRHRTGLRCSLQTLPRPLSLSNRRFARACLFNRHEKLGRPENVTRAGVDTDLKLLQRKVKGKNTLNFYWDTR